MSFVALCLSHGAYALGKEFPLVSLTPCGRVGPSSFGVMMTQFECIIIDIVVLQFIRVTARAGIPLAYRIIHCYSNLTLQRV